MVIDDNGVGRISSGKTDNIQKVDTYSQQVRSGSEAAKSTKDVASVSDEALILAKTRSALDETSEVRSETVANLKQKIENGTYELPVEQLASILMKRLNLS